MSRKTRSGFSRLMREIADLPSPASATISTSVSISNILRRRSRASASSSLSNTRMGIAGTDLLGISSERDVNLDHATSSGCVLKNQSVIVVVELLQASAGIAQANAFARA